MAEALGDLWEQWASGPGGAGLVGAFVVMTACWLSSAGIVLGRARAAWRPPAFPTFSVLVLSLAIAAIGLARPPAFPWFVLAGVASALLLAVVIEVLAGRSVRRCPESHQLAATWSFCPQCPSPLARPEDARVLRPPALASGFVGRNLATLLRRPAPPEGFSPVPGLARVADDVLVRLVPAVPGSHELVVRKPGAAIGRDPAAEIFIDDPTVSWAHARILTRDGAPAVLDLGSSNGSYVNGERIEQSLLLDGDRLQFGDAVFEVVRP